MSNQRHAFIKLDGLEVGLYLHGDHAVVYINQCREGGGGVCIFRQQVDLLPELAAGDGGLTVETLRRLSGTVQIGRH